jgi:hypothetical protein
MPNTFLRKVSSGIGTSLTSVGSYTVPSATKTTVIGLSIANTTGTTPVSVDVSLYNGATDYYIGKGLPVPQGSSIIVIGGDQKVVMETGDSIRVKSSVAASVDVVMSILEIT